MGLGGVGLRGVEKHFFFEGFPKGNSELKTVCKVSTVFNILSQKLYISIMSLTNTAIKFCY